MRASAAQVSAMNPMCQRSCTGKVESDERPFLGGGIRHPTTCPRQASIHNEVRLDGTHSRCGDMLAKMSGLVVGQLLDGTPYRVLRQLGSGGMGVVYEIEHTRLAKRYVAKVMNEA